MYINGSDLSKALWRKSARSVNNGACVELAPAPMGGIAIRDSKDPYGPALLYSLTEWHAFLEGAKKGEFDDLV